ncbi:hypothetical protein NIES3806_03070 [Microcystis aeruginosa NIES-3806]|nr:hypothetical protein NIES3806_03070 [Microcystis aeruginosa NIES-3806]
MTEQYMPLEDCSGCAVLGGEFRNYVTWHFLMTQNIPHLAIPIIQGYQKFTRLLLLILALVSMPSKQLLISPKLKGAYKVF